jgi:N-acetylmuramoyl-L-alanine amidase
MSRRSLNYCPSAGHWTLCAAAIVLALLVVPAIRAWELRSFDGRDHVSMNEVADFYGLAERPGNSPGAKTFSGNGRELTVATNSRQIVINGIAHWLAFPVEQADGKLFLCRLDLGKTLEPAFRPERVAGFPPATTVVLDAGHGGRDNGAHSQYQWEKNFALDVTRRIRNELQKAGVPVVLTRNSDSFVELADRAAVASRLKDAIFVSIHFNATDANRDANGFEIYCVTPRGAPSTAYEQLSERDMVGENGNEHDLHSFALANTIYHSMHGRMKMTDRGVKRARFAVLRQAGVPAVLIEGGFLTNPGDALKIASRPWRDDYAASIARGILEYRNLVAHRIPPRQVDDYRHGRGPAAPAAPAPVAGSPD